jgi:hypothetical protein
MRLIEGFLVDLFEWKNGGNWQGHALLETGA